jgi:hypothetical protein
MSQTPAPQEFEKLDDVMLAMDVVDTLRHEHNMLARDLNADDRRAALIERLRGIYDAQGIEVPDAILLDGVMALEEERFRFSPAAPGFGTRLAKLYINRKKWLPLAYALLVIIFGAWAVNYMVFTRPAHLETRRTASLLDEALPQRLEGFETRALGTNPDAAVKSRLKSLTEDIDTALRAKDISLAETRLKTLSDLTKTLEQSYELRVVNKEREPSGVFLTPKDGGDIRNYYLIVEPVDNAGEVIRVQIEDEEYKKSAWVSKFGVRVPANIFNAVAADKSDDLIIQNDILGRKDVGALDANFNFDRPGGYITDW